MCIYISCSVKYTLWYCPTDAHYIQITSRAPIPQAAVSKMASPATKSTSADLPEWKALAEHVKAPPHYRYTFSLRRSAPHYPGITCIPFRGLLDRLHTC